jgi:DNA-binding response OmpR family regulator
MTWILVAEDNDDLRMHLTEALRERGYDVRAAADGAARPHDAAGEDVTADLSNDKRRED